MPMEKLILVKSKLGGKKLAHSKLAWLINTSHNKSVKKPKNYLMLTNKDYLIS